jgi:hypothetical protein
MTIEPKDAVESNVPKAPLLIARLAFKSGVLGASDMMDRPKRKKIELR